MTCVDSRAFRVAMGRFATGVTVVTTDGPHGPHGMTANAVTSVSLDPPLILVCVGRSARLASYLTHGERFAINVLGEEHSALARYFARDWPSSRPAPDHRFTTIAEATALAGSIATVVCDVTERHSGGDHLIVLGRVRHTCCDHGDRRPLLFFSGSYRSMSGATVQDASVAGTLKRSTHVRGYDNGASCSLTHPDAHWLAASISHR
jgi:flavin reductase